MKALQRAILAMIIVAGLSPAHADTSPPGSTRPDEDPDSDNLVNSEEARMDTLPENPDSDNDGWPDGWEVVPVNPEIRVLAAEETRYALIDVGEAYRVCGVNDNGDILFAALGTSPGTEIGKIWSQGVVTTIGEGKQGSFIGPTGDGSVFSVDNATTIEHTSDIYGNCTTTKRAMRRYHPTEAPAPVSYGLAEEDRSWTGTLPFPFPSDPPNTESLGAFHSGQWSSVWQYITSDVTTQLPGFSVVENPSTLGHYQSVRTKRGRMNLLGDQAMEMTYKLRANFEKLSGNQTHTMSLDLAMGMGGWQGSPDAYSSGAWRVSTELALQDLLAKDITVGPNLYATARVANQIVKFSPGSEFPEVPLPDVTSVSEINDLIPSHGPFFLAATSNGTRLVLDNFGTLEMVPAPSPASTSGIVGQSLSYNLVIPTASGIWRNGKSRSAAELLSSHYWSPPSISFISPVSHILAATTNRVKNDNGEHIAPIDQERRAAILIPCDIAVDANRDGTIKFGGNFYNINNTAKAPDTTSESRPFRFWCNDDDDGIGEGADDPDSSHKDSSDNEIKSLRDLEDFTRLHLYIGGLQDAVGNGTLQVGLEWRNANGTSPSIKVYRAGEPTGGDEYLRNDNNEYHAALQTATPFKTAMGTIDDAGGFKFPSSFWQATSSGIPAFGTNNPTRYLLFEGVSEGKGQLVMTIWKGPEKIGEGPGVWLDLLNIKKMYERGHTVPDFQSRPFDHFEVWNPPPLNSEPYVNGHPFSEPEKEEPNAVVYVHGINGPNGQSTAYESWLTDSETVLKRLWHQGFKGRFASFKWLALTSALPFNYNESEYRGWKSGRALAQFLETMPSGYTKNLYSFSQGAVVCGSALTTYGASVRNYVISQGALPAGCYDTSEAVNSYEDFADAEDGRPTPDWATDLGYRSYLTGLNVTGTVSSFFNTGDFALKSGVFAGIDANWEANQLDYKPNAFSASSRTYIYDSGPPVNPFPSGQRCFLRKLNGLPEERRLSDVHESMAFVARPRSDAVGARSQVDGRVNFLYNVGEGSLSNFSRSQEDHGGQFVRKIQQTQDYYRQIGVQLGVLRLQL